MPMSKTTTECTESRERTDAINKLVNSVLGASSVVRGEMVNHTMTKGMAATERTVEDALAHADSIKQWMKDNPTVPDMPLPDYHLVLLAEEVRQLRSELDECKPVVWSAAKEQCLSDQDTCPENHPDQSYWCASCKARYAKQMIGDDGY